MKFIKITKNMYKNRNWFVKFVPIFTCGGCNGNIFYFNTAKNVYNSKFRYKRPKRAVGALQV